MAHTPPAKSGRVQTIQVGAIREVDTGKRTVTTGIYKEIVEGPVAASGVNLAGDHQADRKVHGGHHMAVYAFPSDKNGDAEAFRRAAEAPGLSESWREWFLERAD